MCLLLHRVGVQRAWLAESGTSCPDRRRVRLAVSGQPYLVGTVHALEPGTGGLRRSLGVFISCRTTAPGLQVCRT